MLASPGELCDFRRVCYYTSAIGDNPYISDISNTISQIRFNCPTEHGSYSGQKFVYKKSSQNQKSRHVDINITVDVMRVVRT